MVIFIFNYKQALMLLSKRNFWSDNSAVLISYCYSPGDILSFTQTDYVLGPGSSRVVINVQLNPLCR